MSAGVNPTPVTGGPVAEQLAENRRAALRLVPVSRETGDRMAAYVDLLARWRKTTNLIAESTFASVWTRHIADFGPAPRPRAASQALDRHGFRGRFSRPGHRNTTR